MSPCLGYPGGSVVKNTPASARDVGSIPGLGRSPGEGNGHPLQYSCLKNCTDKGAWWATVHGVAESDRTEVTEHASPLLSNESPLRPSRAMLGREDSRVFNLTPLILGAFKILGLEETWAQQILRPEKFTCLGQEGWEGSSLLQEGGGESAGDGGEDPCAAAGAQLRREVGVSIDLAHLVVLISQSPALRRSAFHPASAVELPWVSGNWLHLSKTNSFCLGSLLYRTQGSWSRTAGGLCLSGDKEALRQGRRAERPQRKAGTYRMGRCNRYTFRKWDGSEKAPLEGIHIVGLRLSGKEGKKNAEMFREEIRCRQSKR